MPDAGCQISRDKNRIPFFLGICLLTSSVCHSAHADMLSSGTGFFVGRDGYLLTNNHVVERCRGDLTVVGAVPLSSATIVAHDAQNDLALLKSRAVPYDEASLSSEKQPLHAGDPVVIVGYPGKSWQKGDTVTRKAEIIDTKGPRGEEKWLQFSDSVTQGNSGGPLFDSAGNVVGVVAAKAVQYERNETAARDELIRKFDVAISLPVIRRFLNDNGVRYREADSGIYYLPERITDNAQRFVVNVKCRM